MTPPRRLTDRERRRILQVLDLAAVAAALVAAVLTTTGAIRRPAVAWGILVRWAGWLAGLGFLWLLMAHAFEAYAGRVRASAGRSALQLAKAGLAAGVLFLAIAAGLGDVALEDRPGSMALFLVLVVALPAAGRLLYRLLLGRPGRLRPTLVAGTGAAAGKIAEALRVHGGDTYRLVGFAAPGDVSAETPEQQERVPSDGANRAPDVSAETSGPRSGAGGDVSAGTSAPADVSAETPGPVLGTVDRLPELVRRRGVATVVDAVEERQGEEELRAVLDRCLEAGAQVEPMPLLYERLTGRVPLDQLEGAWRAAMPLEHAGGRALGRAAKRAMDLALTSLGVLVMLPVFPLIAAAIKLESPGPVFYAQERVGRGGETITVLKFRSMVADAEAAGEPVWASEDDPRVTRVGRILRAMHVDEFPQFLNILKGEMSIVGPRPERPAFVAELEREIPHYRARHALKPGLGGWGLVNQGYGGSREDARIKHEYDLHYLRRQSLWMDLVILARTFIDTLTLRGT